MTRADVAGGSYFFTVVTERRQPILTLPALRAALRESIETVRTARPCRIGGWVALPDHLHAIWTLPAGDADYATRWRLIKAGVTSRCGALYGDARYLTARRVAKGCDRLWQHRYWEHLLRHDRDVRQHLDYLHHNPVKHGLVKAVKEWLWSSFHRWVRQGHYPEDWAG